MDGVAHVGDYWSVGEARIAAASDEGYVLGLDFVEAALVFRAGDDGVDEGATFVGEAVLAEGDSVGSCGHGFEVLHDLARDGVSLSDVVAEDLLRGRDGRVVTICAGPGEGGVGVGEELRGLGEGDFR